MPPVDTAKLPVLLPRPHPHQPIRAIDADTFADLHLAHLTSDVPDSVLFPFLHGLEGDNAHQNSFFAASSGLNPGFSSQARGANVVKVPRYRGLVWVACDEDDQHHEQVSPSGYTDTLDVELDDAADDFDYRFESDKRQHRYKGDNAGTREAQDDPMQMDIDPPARSEGGDGHTLSAVAEDATAENALDASAEDTAPHMHPLALRKPTGSAPISINTKAHTSHKSFSSVPHAPVSRHDDADSEEHLRGPDQRRLSTCSISTADSASSSSSSSPSTSASGSQYDFGIATSASYSTTASSLEDKDMFDECETESPSTPCTSPLTDICIDDYIPNTNQTDVKADNHGSKHASEDEFPDFDSTHLTVTSSFNPDDLLTTDPSDFSPMFVNPRVPDGISLRNFGIQANVYATLSDVVIYSPTSTTTGRPSRSAFALAQKFKLAIEKKAAERKKRYEDAGVEVVWIRSGKLGEADSDERKGQEDMESDKEQTNLKAHLIAYNVYVLTDPISVVAKKAPWMLSRVPPPTAQSINDPLCSGEFEFFDRDCARGSLMGGVEVVSSGYGLASRSTNSAPSGAVAPTASDGSANLESGSRPSSPNEIPHLVDFAEREREEMRELTRASAILGDVVYLGNASDVPLPAPRSSRSRSHHSPKSRQQDVDGDDELSDDSDLDSDDDDWEDDFSDDPFDNFDNPEGYDVCIECRDCAPIPNLEQLRAAEQHLQGLDLAWNERRKGKGKALPEAAKEEDASSSSVPSSPASSRTVTSRGSPPGSPSSCRRTSSSPITSRKTPRPPPSASNVVHLCFPASPPSFAYSIWALQPFLNFISNIVSPRQSPPSSRPKRVLIFSSDGYTESSVLALCVIMKECGLELPEAYLELQVEKGRSFFVYQSDLGTLKRIEGHLKKERENTRPAQSPPYRARSPPPRPDFSRQSSREWNSWSAANSNEEREVKSPHPYARSPRNSISCPSSAIEAGSFSSLPGVVPSEGQSVPSVMPLRRPRAQTSPLLPLHLDNQAWFNDPRFDGSFPSRVLPFLYLGNLNHAQNAYMLHALGITHVVSVGECALVPPSNVSTNGSSGGYHLVAGRGPGGHGSLWMEEREGRIKVLDIKGVCDDGIDSLQHQLGPVCDWMERAREEGGKILVHCRVGVSRSATVTIAYVMKHLAISLVDAYLIVRSRRLNVLIQPNMRLLYNLCGWEVELARERAKSDRTALCRELARSVNWPFLAREVHRLNAKYLH